MNETEGNEIGNPLPEFAFGRPGVTLHDFHLTVKVILDKAKGDGTLRETTRLLCDRSLFFFMVYILGWTFLNNDFGYSFSDAAQKKKYGRLWILAREHYKSTILTIGSTIREMLMHPTETWCIYSYKDDATRSLFYLPIRNELLRNTKLPWLYPEAIWANPEVESDTFLADKLNLKRPFRRKECTLQCSSILSQKTGYHFDHLIYDDCVTPESVQTPEIILKVIQAFRMSLNTGANDYDYCVVGTFYHYAELYSMIRDEHLCELVQQACYDKKGVPVLMSRDLLEKKRREMGSAVFSSQMLCDPKQASVAAFRPEWLKRWSCKILAGLNIYIIVDPAGKVSRKRDYTCMWVFGLDHAGNIMVMDVIRDKLNLSARTDWVFNLHREYKPLKVFYERVGAQSDPEHIRIEMDHRNYHFPLFEYGQNEDKGVRIETLIPKFERQMIYLPMECYHTNFEGKSEDMLDSFIREEFLLYPFCAHDDGLDSLSATENPAVRPELQVPDEQTENDLILEKMESRGMLRTESEEYHPY